MAKTVEIEVPRLKEFEGLLRKAPMLAKAELTMAIYRSATIIQRLARQEAPIDTGRLRSSIAVEYGPLQARVGPRTNYALAVHEGRRAGAPTPATAMTGWARRKGLNPYAVANSITRRGTKPNRFMKRAAVTATVPVVAEFNRAADTIIKKIARG